jgi:hypothetical protein
MKLLESNDQLELDKIYKLSIISNQKQINKGYEAEVVAIVLDSDPYYTRSIIINTILTNNNKYWNTGRDHFNINVMKVRGYDIFFQEL